MIRITSVTGWHVRSEQAGSVGRRRRSLGALGALIAALVLTATATWVAEAAPSVVAQATGAWLCYPDAKGSDACRSYNLDHARREGKDSPTAEFLGYCDLMDGCGFGIGADARATRAMSSKPSYAKCRAARYHGSGTAYTDQWGKGTWVCIRTGGGRHSRVHIVDPWRETSGATRFVFDFVTWDR